MSAAASYPTHWRRPPAFFGTRRRYWLFIGGVILYFAWSLSTLNIDVERMLAGLPRALDIFARMVPPDFSKGQLLLKGMLESLQMAFAATLIGAILAVPLGIAAARNIAPRPVYLAARGFIVLNRTFHEIIIAIFFVKLFGFGAVAGLLTLALSSWTFCGKMLAEDIENVRMGQIEAVRATGAGFAQTVVFSVVPQVLSRTVGVLIYRLDANVRHSTVIGIVGAGGIGQTLSASFSRYDYDFAAAILLCIAALVALGEWFSDWVRRKLR
ncbi:MAG: phosphonate ABC transporter, permease protein PhnE [Betaproteobacteria bacterium]|nr:phosphonate ABC transporter, permease protein PhnE [Betaproteobacteria bacterium]